MKITVRELFDRDLWAKYCEISDTNVWAVNEGLLDENDEIELTDKEMQELFLIHD